MLKMKTTLRFRSFEFRSLLMCLLSDLFLLLTFSALGLWVFLRTTR
jgi:hypothetical protein